jgi:hypothetical protein
MRHWQLAAEENDGHYSPHCFRSMIFQRCPVPETNSVWLHESGGDQRLAGFYDSQPTTADGNRNI